MSDESPCASGSRKRSWFWIGFIAVFVGLLFLVNQSSHVKGGLGIFKLWEFYIVEFRRALGPQNLGPASGSGGRALYVFCLHVAASGVGGLLAIGIRRLTLSFRNKVRRESEWR